jgi:hypothetical protein
VLAVCLVPERGVGFESGKLDAHGFYIASGHPLAIRTELTSLPALGELINMILCLRVDMCSLHILLQV